MTQFAVLYTIGNIIALFSTAFLFGPMRQVKNMFHSKRALATVIYLVTLGGTLAVAFTVCAGEGAAVAGCGLAHLLPPSSPLRI